MTKNQLLDAVPLILALDLDREDRAMRVAEVIRASGPYRWVGIYDVNIETGMVSNIAWSGPGPPAYPTFPINQGLTSRAITTKGTINVGNVATDPDYLTALGNSQSEIIVPVLDQSAGMVIGTIDVESEKRDAFDEHTQRLLEKYAKALRPLWATHFPSLQQ